jgi:hypothetical protein
MRRIIAESVFICGLMLTVNSATSQSTTNADDGSPYGGVAVTPGSLPVGSGILGPLPPSGSTPCLTGTTADPCVLTGQYNRYRTSTNTNEPSLAGFNNSTFGMAYFYKLTSTPPNAFPYEPVIAQPLYITHVPFNGGTPNMLIVASLNDYVYAFDTSTGNQLWPAITWPARQPIARAVYHF